MDVLAEKRKLRYNFFMKIFSKKNCEFLFTSIFLVSIFSCAKNQSPKIAQPAKGVYYCIFVRSFADSNGDGIGDLNGIASKLDYLENLGVSGIWLMPIFPSHSYHGYDVDDYYNVNEEYGTISDLENLCAKCAERGISVILDLPLNHSSIHNKWFLQSIDEKNPKHSWYRWANPQENPDINFNATIWQHKVWNKRGENFYSGLYYDGMPDFNHDNLEVRDEFKNIIKFWLEKGVSGFRFDAASHIYNSAKLPSSVKDGQERALNFWNEICSYAKSVKSDAFMVGEVWESNGTRAEYMRSIPSTFHFDLGTKIINAIKNSDGMNNSIAAGLLNDYELYAQKNPNFIDAPFLTNHDQNRSPLQFKNDERCVKLAAAMYLFLPGIPFVYYGEEIAMNGAKPDEQIRTPFIWSSKSNEKMQTDWIESKYNAKTKGAAEQLKDKNSVLNFYKDAIHFRNSNEVFSHGKFLPYETKNSKITSWTLESGEKKVFVFFNLADEEQKIARPKQSENFKILFSANPNGAKISNDEILLAPKNAVVFGN